MNIAGKFRGLLSDSFYVPRSLVDKRIVKVLKCNYFKKKEVNNDSREELVNVCIQFNLKTNCKSVYLCRM